MASSSRRQDPASNHHPTPHNRRRKPGGLDRRRRSWTSVVAFALLIALIASALIGPGPASAQTRSVDEYQVKPGDSLSVIARNHGVSTRTLAAENGISNVHLVRVGQVLRIPGIYYVVRAGDTLSGIAVSAGTSMSELAATNGIQNLDRIRIGQRLRLPVVSSTRSVNPAAGYGRLPARLRADPARLNLIPSFEKWAAHYGVPADVLMAVAYRESGWQQGVISPKGAIGVGQLMPRTAEWIAQDLIRVADLDPYDPDDNIRMSARFLAWLKGYMGSLDAALAGYYQGPGSVAALGYFDDTTDYISNIKRIRAMFRKG